MADSTETIDLTPDEQRAYLPLYQTGADVEGNVSGGVAVRLFKESKLGQKQLNDIWRLCNPKGKASLTKTEFFRCLRCIGKAQMGLPISGGSYLTEGPIAHLKPGLGDSNDSLASTPHSSPNPSGGSLRISEAEFQRFNTIFEKTQKDGRVDGVASRSLFMQSQLPVDKLGRVWELGDSGSKGYLTKQDFMVAMCLIQRTLDRSLPTLPVGDPHDLRESIQQLIGRESRQSSMALSMARSATTASLVASPTADLLSFDPSSASSVTPSAPSIPKADSISDIDVRIASPTVTTLHRPSMQAVNATKSPLPNVGSAWSIPPDERKQFDDFFAQLDTKKRGFLSGEELANFFLQSKLSEGDLMKIWDLADLKKQGQLNRDEFAIAMFLIRKKRSGNPIPDSLPPELLPQAAQVDSLGISSALASSSQSIHSTSSPAMTSEMDQVTAMTQQVKDQRSKLETYDLRNAEAQRHELIINVSQLKAIYEAEKGLLADLERQVGQLAAEVERSRSEKNLIETNLGNLRGERNTLQTKLQSLQREREELDGQTIQLRTQVQSAQADVDGLRTTVARESAVLEASKQALQLAQKNVHGPLGATATGTAIGSLGPSVFDGKSPFGKDPFSSFAGQSDTSEIFGPNGSMDTGSRPGSATPTAAMIGGARPDRSPLPSTSAIASGTTSDPSTPTTTVKPDIASSPASFKNSPSVTAIAHHRPASEAGSSTNMSRSATTQVLAGSNRRMTASSIMSEQPQARRATSASVSPVEASKKPTLDELASIVGEVQKSASNRESLDKTGTDPQGGKEDEPDFEARFPDLDELNEAPTEEEKQADSTSTQELSSDVAKLDLQPSLPTGDSDQTTSKLSTSLENSIDKTPVTSSTPAYDLDAAFGAANATQSKGKENWSDPFGAQDVSQPAPVPSTEAPQLPRTLSFDPSQPFGADAPQATEPFVPDFASAFEAPAQVALQSTAPSRTVSRAGTMPKTHFPTTAEDLEAIFNEPSGQTTPVSVAQTSNQVGKSNSGGSLSNGGLIDSSAPIDRHSAATPPGGATFGPMIEEGKINEVVSFGFGRDQAVEALRRYDSDSQKALNWLLDEKEIK